jgi:hypothetical protein
MTTDDDLPPPANAAQHTLIRVQYKTGQMDYWRCQRVAVDANSRFLQLINASSYLEDREVLRTGQLSIVLDALVLWTTDAG